MRSRDLELKSQGQGHAKVTMVKTLRKMRFSRLRNAECEANIQAKILYQIFFHLIY